jgi:hypothetical protein
MVEEIFAADCGQRLFVPAAEQAAEKLFAPVFCRRLKPTQERK